MTFSLYYLLTIGYINELIIPEMDATGIIIIFAFFDDSKKSKIKRRVTCRQLQLEIGPTVAESTNL